jgi:hypothetical protein
VAGSQLEHCCLNTSENIFDKKNIVPKTWG